MIESWVTALPTILVVIASLSLPGISIIAIGWGIRDIRALLVAPAVSLAAVGAAAVIAPWLGMTWGVLPVVLLTAFGAAVAFLLRRGIAAGAFVKDDSRVHLTAALTVSVVFFAIAGQLIWAFGSPDSIAQRFDNIVHLNSVQYAVTTGNASAFNIGATSDIAFYPNAWHATAALASVITGASIPVAVNAANIVIAALVWPTSVMALSSWLAGARSVSLIASGLLSAGFGAFPALFFNWGTLYPNAAGYAMVPATMATMVSLTRSRGIALVRDGVLVVLLAGGTFLAHPNALIASIALGGPLILAILGQRALATRTRRDAMLLAGSFFGLAFLAGVLWTVGRTSAEHSSWVPWQSTAQAVGEALLVAPRGLGPAWVAAALMIPAAVVICRHPSRWVVAVPLAVATLLFVLSSGTPRGFFLRELITNPWYNDSNRLAALLPIGAIPIAALGAVALVKYVRSKWPSSPIARAAWTLGVAAACLAAFALVVAGPNVRGVLIQVREAHTALPGAPLLSPDERALLERLDDVVPADALVMGSPRTGTSLAFALSERAVTEMHVYGTRSQGEDYLRQNLVNIETDPLVCEYVRETGVDFVLDFGDRDIMDNVDLARFYDGMQNLEPNDALALIDSEGDDARLFQIVGC